MMKRFCAWCTVTTALREAPWPPNVYEREPLLLRGVPTVPWLRRAIDLADEIPLLQSAIALAKHESLARFYVASAPAVPIARRRCLRDAARRRRQWRASDIATTGRLWKPPRRVRFVSLA